jgi:hypothetical protein
MEWYLNNREIIQNLSINTGTSGSPTFTTMCTTSEIEVSSEFEQTDWYVFCDAIQRSLITGVALSINATVKLDINNTAIQNIIAKIHTLLTSGTVAQFNNQLIKFDLLTSVSSNVLTYTTYEVPCTLNFSDLGGPAEEEGEFSLEIHINGKGTVVS